MQNRQEKLENRIPVKNIWLEKETNHMMEFDENLIKALNSFLRSLN